MRRFTNSLQKYDNHSEKKLKIKNLDIMRFIFQTKSNTSSNYIFLKKSCPRQKISYRFFSLYRSVTLPFPPPQQMCRPSVVQTPLRRPYKYGSHLCPPLYWEQAAANRTDCVLNSDKVKTRKRLCEHQLVIICQCFCVLRKLIIISLAITQVLWNYMLVTISEFDLWTFNKVHVDVWSSLNCTLWIVE